MALVKIRSANLSSASKLIMDPHKVRAKPRDFFSLFFFLLLLFYGFNISFLISPSLLLFFFRRLSGGSLFRFALATRLLLQRRMHKGQI